MAVGPVEYLVVTFPGGRFADAIAPVLADAVASEAVRILDLAFARRAGGTLEYVELREMDPQGLVSFDPPDDLPPGCRGSPASTSWNSCPRRAPPR